MIRKAQADKIKPWAVVVALIVWQITAMIINQKILLTSPVDVFIRLLAEMQTAVFWKSIVSSLGRIFFGFSLALTLGIILAVLASKFEVVKDLLAPWMIAIKSIPVASFVILILFWFSSKNLSIFIGFLMVLPIIYTNMVEGILNTDKNLLEMAKIFGMPKGKQYRYVYYFEILPFLVSAVKVSLGMCFKAGIAAEVIGTPANSIGRYIFQTKISLDTSGLFAWTLAIVILSVLFEKFVMHLLSLLTKVMEGVK